MVRSEKHHYLPQFYLNGFTNENGTFSIYDCQRKKISPKNFYPKSKFYDNRNLIEFNGVISDIPETMYSYMDDRHKGLLKKIQASKSVPDLTIDEMLHLQEFVSTVFWRLPGNDEYYMRKYFSDPDFTKNMAIRNSQTGLVDEEKTKEIISSDYFARSIKPFISTIQMMQSRNNLDLANWQLVYNGQGNNICSDNPFLFRKDNPENIFDSEFIFPLSKHHSLIRTFRRIEQAEMNAGIMALIELLQFSQANIYCCCPDKEKLERTEKELANLTLDKSVLFKVISDKNCLNELNRLSRR